MPQYKKFFDIGTYQGNGTQYRIGIPEKRDYVDALITKSLRFDPNQTQYTGKTIITTGDRQKFTLSMWIKRSAVSSVQGYQVLWMAGTDQTDSTISLNFDLGASFNNVLYFRGYNTIWMFAPVQGPGAPHLMDPDTWNHLVLAVDTTQATAGNRALMYINGTLVSRATNATITQNTNFSVNTAGESFRLGHQNANWGYAYFSGYMSDVYFIDGRQLAASNFGQKNSDGIWVPKSYTGHYGVNGYHLEFNDTSTETFNNLNAYSEVFDVPTGGWTQSTHGGMAVRTNTTEVTSPDGATGADKLVANTGFNYHLISKTVSGVIASRLFSMSVFAKAGEHHILYITESNTTGAALLANTVNGQIISVISNNQGLYNAKANSTFYANGWYRYELSFTTGASQTAVGYIIWTCNNATQVTSNLAFNGDGTSGLYVWGSQVSANANTLYHGTGAGNQPDLRYRITRDTANNLNLGLNTLVNANFDLTSNTSTSYSSYSDSPCDSGTDTGVGGEVAGNYATINANIIRSYELFPRRGALEFYTASGSNVFVGSTVNFPMTRGQWYWEIFINQIGTTAGTWCIAGVADAGIEAAGFTNTNTYLLNYTNVSAWINDRVSATYTNNDYLGIALDVDNRIVSYYKNGLFIFSENLAVPSTSRGFIPVLQFYRSTTQSQAISCNFGQRRFVYAAPSGYKTLCSKNVIAPADSSLWFYGDTPDLVMVKNRTNAANNVVFDSLNPVVSRHFSNEAGSTKIIGYSSLSKYGVTLISSDSSDIATNQVGANFVYYALKANGSTGVAGTSGNASNIIVSANRSSGFSIANFTTLGAGTTVTVDHGLNAVPSLIIVKSGNSASGWLTYLRTSGPGFYARLNTNGALVNDSTYFPVAPTSSVFTVGSALSGTYDWTAYSFAEVEGFSQFGQYDGTAAVAGSSADGRFIYTPFRPRFVMVKRTSSTGDWSIWDAVRSSYNVINATITTNSTSAESGSGGIIDFYANGFKFRYGAANYELTGSTYAYAAFAENPFRYALAR